MSQLVVGLLPVLGLSALLGLGAGWLSGLPRDRVGAAVAGGLVLVLAVLAGLGLSKAVPGAAGLWIETAGLMLAAYLGGCGAGAGAKAVLTRGRPV